MNQIVKELRDVKNYTSESIKYITDYVNKLGGAVSEDMTAVLKELNSLNNRIDIIEEKLGIEKPKQIKTVVENVKAEEVGTATKGVKVGKAKKTEVNNE